MNLFYSNDIENDCILLSEEESKHALKVMRAGHADIIHVTDGKGKIYKTRIEDQKPKRTLLKIIDESSFEQPQYNIHIAIAPTKNHDRLEWFIEKATEIGVTEITPIICQHSERKSVQPERLERIMIAAIKQSGKAWLPILHSIMPFSEFIRTRPAGNKYIAFCSQEKKEYLKNIYSKGTNALVLIGPEGDFSTDEIRTSSEMGFHPVSLGNTRYRTETAAIIACHTLSLINEKE